MASYEEFVEKFKPKKTTDDCYTPPEVYKIIKDYVVERWNLQGVEIIRPFYPGGDFENFKYPENCIVLDNPPFSILAKIKRFYNERGIKFFLFAPALRLFGNEKNSDCNYLVVNESIIYDNGAIVLTSFVHNLESEKIETSTELKKSLKSLYPKRNLAKYNYPCEVITASRLDELMKKGIDVKLKKEHLHYIRKLDNSTTEIFGQAFLYKQPFDFRMKDDALNIELSEREKEIIKQLKEVRSIE